MTAGQSVAGTGEKAGWTNTIAPGQGWQLSGSTPGSLSQARTSDLVPPTHSLFLKEQVQQTDRLRSAHLEQLAWPWDTALIWGDQQKLARTLQIFSVETQLALAVFLTLCRAGAKALLFNGNVNNS